MIRYTTQESKAEPTNNITTLQKNTHYKELMNFYENNKNKMDEYRQTTLYRKRKHFVNYEKEWCLKNKDTHDLKRKERIMCECGMKFAGDI